MTNTNPAVKDRRLGKGLAALLGTPMDDADDAGSAGAGGTGRSAAATAPRPASASPQRPTAASPQQAGGAAGMPPLTAKQFAAAEAAGGSTCDLAVDQIDANPFQPRRDFNPSEIASLAASLQRHEQLQPVLVRRVGKRYQLISGERRLRAAVHAGLPTVRAEIREADDRLVAELAIVENVERKDLNPIEKAMCFKRYIDQHKCTQEALGKRLGLDRSTVTNLMRLLELPQRIIDQIIGGEITAGHARAILPLGEEDLQCQLAQQIIDEGWTVRKVEAHVGEMLRQEREAEGGLGEPPKGNRGKRTVTPHIEAMETELKHQLGTKVEIKQTAKGRGKIMIHFTDADEFDRIRAILADQSVPPLRIAG